MQLPILQLKKGEDTRLLAGHVWVYSNEVDTRKTSLKSLSPGSEVLVKAANLAPLGVAYVNPHSLITARLFSRDTQTRLNAGFLLERLKTALSLREQLFPKPFYRLAFGESDGLPGLVIDRYDRDLVAQINTYGMELKKDDILEALKTLLPDMRSLLFRNDSSIRSQEGLESYTKPGYGEVPESLIIEENETRFHVPLWQGQKTGWFFDHRMNRARLKDYVHEKTLLDVFCYLGGWGIEAAHFGARLVTCVDTSAFACEWTAKNAALNKVENNVEVICDEAVPALQKLHQTKKKYDVIVLDPPAFIKRRKDHKEGLLAYLRINTLALRLLNPGGILVAGSCSMHLSYEDLITVLQRAARETHCQLQILERGHQAPDHPVHLSIPETDYLKAIFLRKL